MSTAENVHYLPGHEPNQEADQSAGRGSGAQLEDGYVRTANDIVEGLMKAPLTSRESRIIRAVERATYGWQRSSARLSQSVLAEMTGLTAKRCSEAVNSLLKKKVLFRDGGSQSPIGINTRVSEWDFSTEKSKNVPNLARDTNWGQSPQTRDEKRPQNRDTNKDRKDNTPSLRSGVGASKGKTASGSSTEYTADFEAAWSLYPKRSGSNPKREAFKAWNARISEGFSTDDMVAGLKRYAAHVSAKGNWGTEFVMQGKRFFGPSAEFETEWAVATTTPASGRQTPGRHSNLQSPDTSNLVKRGDGTYEF
ncbi:phage replication protein O [Kushneria sinocarnis]|uniref:Phage replication protein O n=1 Tax=Kushneria sinocarnis TaxID=595502 RepID=A0A420WUL7_9GAMM|nr:replication protein [Kushneria sinocarnis]RKQ97120.1 phage replication protein O [Kushneria sinocarnis]